MRRLIVNADDFGLAEPVNLGIIKAHREGILTSTTFLACGQAPEHAAALARENPSLGVGIHLALNRETPVSDPARVPTITRGGRFYFGHSSLMARVFTGLASRDEIERELRAQIEKALSLGLKPTHMDGHHHLFIMPVIFPIALRLAREYNIPAARFPVGPATRNMPFPKAAEKAALEFFAARQKATLDASGIKRPDHFFGLPETGSLDADSLAEIIAGLPEGTSEVMCHPGIRDDALAERLDWGRNWQAELDAVTDARVKVLVEERGIRLINFGDI